MTTIIIISLFALYYYFDIIKPVSNEQKSASKETESPIDFNEADEHFIPVEKEQLN